MRRAFRTYTKLLPFLAALSIIEDGKTASSDQMFSAKLREYLRKEDEMFVPFLSDELRSQEKKYVHHVKLGKGIIVPPGTKVSKDQTDALSSGYHRLEPIVCSAKLSQGWTTYVHTMDFFRFPKQQGAKAQPCSLFPGCDGIDEYGLPECDQELARQIVSGFFDLDFTEEELNHAKESLAGDRDCTELREKISEKMRMARRSFSKMPLMI